MGHENGLLADMGILFDESLEVILNGRMEG